jgi:hypothetical protein
MKNFIAQDRALPDLDGMTQEELEEHIISSLHQLAISAERIEMLRESCDTIKEPIAGTAARFPRKLCS